MSEGELKKRIREAFKGWIGAEHSDYIQGKNDGRAEVSVWLDEAKQEFPTVNSIIEQCKETDINPSTELLAVARYKWFKKWFGSEAEKK